MRLFSREKAASESEFSLAFSDTIYVTLATLWAWIDLKHMKPVYYVVH